MDHDSNSTMSLEVAPQALAGKTASEAEIVRWVARNIDNPNASPADCPDPFAWTLLRQCRDQDNPGFVSFFTEKLWAKLLPSRAQLEEQGGTNAIDGKITLDLIERIREVSSECGEGVGVPAESHDLGAAGLIHAPATIPDAFGQLGEGEEP